MSNSLNYQVLLRSNFELLDDESVQFFFKKLKPNIFPRMSKNHQQQSSQLATLKCKNCLSNRQAQNPVQNCQSHNDDSSNPDHVNTQPTGNTNNQAFNTNNDSSMSNIDSNDNISSQNTNTVNNKKNLVIYLVFVLKKMKKIFFFF